MTLEELIGRIRTQPDTLRFDEVIAAIDAHYDFYPTRFSTGHGDIVNEAGSNEGSCRILAFAQLQGLSREQALACFGDYYRTDVLRHPAQTRHANIRAFMTHGWEGVHFDRMPLRRKQS